MEALRDGEGGWESMGCGGDGRECAGWLMGAEEEGRQAGRQ